MDYNAEDGTITAYLINEKSDAINIGDGETKEASSVLRWIPKAQIEITDHPKDRVGTDNLITFEIPEWLAQNKGLI